MLISINVKVLQKIDIFSCLDSPEVTNQTAVLEATGSVLYSKVKMPYHRCPLSHGRYITLKLKQH